MIRRSAATAAAACTSSSGFVRTLARGRPRGPARRREPRQALPQPPQPPPAEASPAVDVASSTPINASDKRWAWASLVFGSLAIGGLTLNKWEIEKRLEGCAGKKAAHLRGLGPFTPPARPSSARSSSGQPPASASLGQLADMFTALFSTQAQGAAARAGGAVEVRRVRRGPSGGRQGSASSTEAGDLSPQCQSCGFCGDGATSRSRSFSRERLYACLSLTQLRPLNRLTRINRRRGTLTRI